MRRTEIAERYPNAARIITRLIDEGRCHPRALVGLTEAALERIDRGETSPRDAAELLRQRSKPRSTP
jgi:hypothetical protein